ncbi:DUF1937 family protein [Bradyrhizobium sp. USDA 4532]|uniref:DUF1937 family protein n=1 Tax=unclassified Bradyrhizobium TaxID=2631580 RepID=UPI0035C6B28E
MDEPISSRSRSEPNEPKSYDVVYLACPYTHSDPAVRRYRFESATRAAADLIKKGRIVFSPITMTHPIDIVLAGESNTLGSDYWVAFDEAFMEMCSEIVVLTLDGWEQSRGIQREIEYFKDRRRPIQYMDPPSSISLNQ